MILTQWLQNVFDRQVQGWKAQDSHQASKCTTFYDVLGDKAAANSGKAKACSHPKVNSS